MTRLSFDQWRLEVVSCPDLQAHTASNTGCDRGKEMYPEAPMRQIGIDFLSDTGVASQVRMQLSAKTKNNQQRALRISSLCFVFLRIVSFMRYTPNVNVSCAIQRQCHRPLTAALVRAATPLPAKVVSLMVPSTRLVFLPAPPPSSSAPPPSFLITRSRHATISGSS